MKKIIIGFCLSLVLFAPIVAVTTPTSGEDEPELTIQEQYEAVELEEEI